MDFKKLLGNFSAALAAQGLNMAVGVLTTLLVPKVLGVTEFGYWQLFVFYAGYVGFFHLGLADGVYLREGGHGRDVIDKRDVNSQFWFSLAYQLVFAGAIVALAATGFFGPDRSFVLLFTALYLVVNNAVTFLGYVFQCMNETKAFSLSVAINSIAFLVPLVALLVVQDADFRTYVEFYVVAKMVSLLYLGIKARSFFAAGLERLSQTWRTSVESIRCGFKLMIANFSATLILGIARFLIDGSWGIEEFSYVSFALSIVTFFMLFVSQASMVLFPALRQVEPGQVGLFFLFARDALDLALPVVYLLYAPAVWLLGLWLPQYAPSFPLFALLLPLCVFNGKMNVVGNTFYKVLRMEGKLLALNVATLALSTAGALVGTFALHSVDFVIGSAVVAVVVRSLWSEQVLSRRFDDRLGALSLGSVLLSAVFLIATLALPMLASWVVVAVAYAVHLAVFRKKLVQARKRLGILKS